MSIKIACIGMVTVDYLRVVSTYPLENSESKAIDCINVIGGPIGRGAVAASRLGAQVDLIAACGDDANYQILSEMLGREKITPIWFQQKNTTSQHSFVLISGDNGNRTIVWTQQPRACRQFINQLPELIEGYDCVLMDCTDESLSHAVAEAALLQGVPTVVDTGSYKPWVESLLPKVTHLISPKKFFTKRNPDLSENETLKLLYETLKPTLWGLTDSENGGMYISSETNHKINTYDALDIDAIDTCGAGDTFHGAFAFAVANSFDHKSSFRLASFSAGKKCTILGNEAIPYKTDIDEALFNKTEVTRLTANIEATR